MATLIIQIPCYNEEATLPTVLAALPRRLPGVGRIEWLVVNDGSTDRTAEVAVAHGVDHLVSRSHEGLARAFMAGIEAALRAGADIILNIDADNQYLADDIPRLIEPILAGRADVVIGARPISEMKHFSTAKRLLQRLGSRLVRLASGTEVPDAASGFRAISREAALRLNVFNEYTFTLELIIQAGTQRMRIASVPVRANVTLRPSRLIRNLPLYLARQLLIVLRIFMVYRPLQFFALLGSVPFVAGFALGVRWLLLFSDLTPARHIPSLILATLLMLVGVQLWIFGLIADLMAVNRRVLEDIQLRVRRAELDRAVGRGPTSAP